MPGFTGFIGGEKLKFEQNYDSNNFSFLYNNTIGKNYFFEWNVNKKFINDKLFFEDDNYLIITDGVLLNSSQLMKKYHGENLVETFINMYESMGELFFNEIRGSYSCVFFNKNENIWLIYTDQLGDKKVYYSILNEGIILGSRIFNISETLKNNKKAITLNDVSCLSMLTFGYMIDDNTMVKEIKRLLPGNYIRIKDGKIDLNKYHEFNNKPLNDMSDEQLIEELDNLFRNAVKLQFEKDKEYGYKHISSLSGGLDSRMVNIVAHELGYEDILNYTFSQSNYLDEKIAKEIAVDLNHEFIFKSLDDAKFLYDIDSIIKINGGTSIYYGLAHSKNNLDIINLDQFGLVHTGQIGDVIVGSFSKTPNYEKINFSNYVYSTMFQDQLNDMSFIEYENDEMFKMYNRGFNFALNGNLSFQEKTESFSPFYNVEFMQFCLNIPISKRVNHNLYYKWIINKYPIATNYVYERIKAKITTPKVYIKIKDFVIRALNKTFKVLNLPSLYGYNTKRGMNPFDYWYRNNQNFKDFITNYYMKHLNNLNDHEKIKEMCEKLFNHGITVEKIQVLTILATVKMIYGENE